MTLGQRVKRCVVVGIVAGSVAVVACTAEAVTLDEDTFAACARVQDLTPTTPSRRDARAAGRSLAALPDRTPRKRLGPALLEASTAEERTRAVRAAYRWCDREAQAYEDTLLSLSVPAVVDIVDTDVVTISGSASPGATVTLAIQTPAGTRTAEVTADGSGAFAIPVSGVPMGETTITVRATAPLRYPSRAVVLEVRRSESEAAFKASAREVPVDELEKDPAGLRGTRIYSRGEVFQYDARTGLTAMLVHVRLVNPGRFEFWTDPVLLRFDTAALGNGIDQKDIIEFWGEIQGAYSYTTAIGGSNTVPEIRARYVALLEKR